MDGLEFPQRVRWRRATLVGIFVRPMLWALGLSGFGLWSRWNHLERDFLEAISLSLEIFGLALLYLVWRYWRLPHRITREGLAGGSGWLLARWRDVSNVDFDQTSLTIYSSRRTITRQLSSLAKVLRAFGWSRSFTIQRALLAEPEQVLRAIGYALEQPDPRSHRFQEGGSWWALEQPESTDEQFLNDENWWKQGTKRRLTEPGALGAALWEAYRLPEARPGHLGWVEFVDSSAEKRGYLEG
jgi:hypothetical protein